MWKMYCTLLYISMLANLRICQLAISLQAMVVRLNLALMLQFAFCLCYKMSMLSLPSVCSSRLKKDLKEFYTVFSSLDCSVTPCVLAGLAAQPC